MKHWKYLWYVMRHKWFVFIAARQLGIAWRGITHDLSKFRPDEWGPYAEHFYGNSSPSWDKSKTKPVDTGDAVFDKAWMKHLHRNPHHWQWYCLPVEYLGVTAIEMELKDCLEMIADWRGAGRAKGYPDTVAWYLTNRERMNLHDNTILLVETQLGLKQN